jgi:ubiquinone biosynthesis protein UbiJ
VPTGKKRGEQAVSVPPSVALKAAVYLAVRDAGISNSELARRCAWTRRKLDGFSIRVIRLSCLGSSRRLAGFVDRVGLATGLVFPMLAASAATLLITAVAALRHVRQALALQPIEALS